MKVVGPATNPIWIGKKSEIPNLFTEQFWRIYEIWRMQNLGFGFPDGVAYNHLEPVILEAVAQMEEHYRKEFSHENYIRSAVEPAINRLDAIIKVNRRR